MTDTATMASAWSFLSPAVLGGVWLGIALALGGFASLLSAGVIDPKVSVVQRVGVWVFVLGFLGYLGHRGWDDFTGIVTATRTSDGTVTLRNGVGIHLGDVPPGVAVSLTPDRKWVTVGRYARSRVELASVAIEADHERWHTPWTSDAARTRAFADDLLRLAGDPRRTLAASPFPWRAVALAATGLVITAAWIALVGIAKRAGRDETTLAPGLRRLRTWAAWTWLGGCAALVVFAYL